MQEKPSSSFSLSSILALVLIGVAWMSWHKHMKKKYPDFFQTKERISKTEENLIKEDSGENAGTEKNVLDSKTKSFFHTSLDKTEQEGSRLEAQKETLVSFEDSFWSFSVSSRGMGIKNLFLKKFFDRKFQPMHLGGGKKFLPLENHLFREDIQFLSFDVQRKGTHEFVGEAYREGVKVIKHLTVDSKNYFLKVKLQITSPKRGFQGLLTAFSDRLKEEKKGSFFLPYFGQELYISHQKEEKERRNLSKEENWSASFQSIKILAFSSQYFTMAFLNQAEVLPQMEVSTSRKNEEILGLVIHKTFEPTERWELGYSVFMGPKSYELLNGLGGDLKQIVNFGFFGFIGNYMLILMKFFFQIVQNWGMAIILLTLLIRFILLPLNIKSYRSMKSMQRIQPEIKAIREKFKDSPQKMNQEVMSLMRTHKVNPIGGCLPMLLQFPIFIALYKVLGQSVELYQAPFVFWLKDLSQKDPYYVLPLLMGAVMFLQQKITPSPMDPTQAKILMFMPILFTFFMLTLPSGLTLYILVSSLFAVVQQFFFMKENSKTQPQLQKEKA